MLLFGHDTVASGALLTGLVQPAGGIVAGFAIGVVASLIGVAGGERLIPTLVLLFGANIKLAGSLSLAVSLPTMLVGSARYSRDRSFSVLGENGSFLMVMAAGSIVGTFIGGHLLGLVPTFVLLPSARDHPVALRREGLATSIAIAKFPRMAHRLPPPH